VPTRSYAILRRMALVSAPDRSTSGRGRDGRGEAGEAAPSTRSWRGAAHLGETGDHGALRVLLRRSQRDPARDSTTAARGPAERGIRTRPARGWLIPPHARPRDPGDEPLESPHGSGSTGQLGTTASPFDVAPLGSGASANRRPGGEQLEDGRRRRRTTLERRIICRRRVWKMTWSRALLFGCPPHRQFLRFRPSRLPGPHGAAHQSRLRARPHSGTPR